MKIGIYCRELDGPTGTPKSTVLAAWALRREGHDVSVLARRAASKARLTRLFGPAARTLRVVEIEDDRIAARTADYDLFINQIPGLYFPSLAPRSWLWFRATPATAPRHLGFYRVFGNSLFTVGRLRRLWGVRSELLYPPIGVGDFSPGPKDKMILSVGVLGASARPKNELEMIRLFKKLHGQGKVPGWTYHLAGELEGGPRWLARLKSAAVGAPVRLHVAAPLRRMQGLYGRAALLWHACGEEHFGGALVEAMAAGCVVLALNKGGPREIIRSGVDGRLYGSLSELGRLTLQAADGRLALAPLARKARGRSRRFGLESFQRRMCSLIRNPSP